MNCINSGKSKLAEVFVLLLVAGLVGCSDEPAQGGDDDAGVGADADEQPGQDASPSDDVGSDECEFDAQLEISAFEVSSMGESYEDGDSFSIPRGETVQVWWQAPGAFSCVGAGLTGTDNWDDAIHPPFSSGPVTIETADLVEGESYVLELVCNNGDHLEASRQVTITITEGQPTDPCADVPSLEEASGGALVRTSDVLIDEDWDGFEYANIFGASFPGIIVQRRFRLLPYTYASMRFDTPADLNASHYGNWSFEVLAGTSSGIRLMSVSSCEGDFDAANLEDGCIRSLVGGDTFNWGGGEGTVARCALEPDTEYYLNIIYSYNEPGDAPEEIEWGRSSDERCGNLIIPGHNHGF